MNAVLLVDRLREEAEYREKQDLDGSLLREAANEIENLRSQLCSMLLTQDIRELHDR